jgi:hypothetical protein
MVLTETGARSSPEFRIESAADLPRNMAELLRPAGNRPSQSIYLLNTLAYLSERGVTVGQLEDSDLESLAGGHDSIYALGIWKRGAEASRMARTHRHEYLPVRDQLREEEIVGSAFANCGTVLEPLIAHSEREWRKFRERLNRMGKQVYVDGVFNHTGVGDRLAADHPELYFRNPQGVGYPVPTRTGETVYLANGMDPNYPGGWEDTLQLNWANPETHEQILRRLKTIADMSDGIRLDMAMLVNPATFERTWGWRLSPEEKNFLWNNPFWPRAVAEIRSTHPRYRFLAEAYWETDLLRSLGMEVYAKEDLYNLAGWVMEGEQVAKLREFIRCQSPEVREHSVRFIENHDEARAWQRWGEASLPLAAAIAFIPGGYFLVHDGQERGLTKKVPMQISRYGDDRENAQVAGFYADLLAFRASRAFQEGSWKLTDVYQCGSDPTSANLVGHQFILQGEGGMTVVANLRQQTARGYVPISWGKRVTVYDARLRRWLGQNEIANADNNVLYVEIPEWGVQYILTA